jgi:DNA polymerase-3 subunit alpha
VMQKEKRNFLSGAREMGYSSQVAEEVFALIEPFAGYAFNKAHSFSYALIAYQTAYLKANYPAEYITAFLVTHADQQDKVATAVAECRRLGIEVLPPDVNRSQVTFSIEPGEEGKAAIRFGLNAIKNVGVAAVEPLVKERLKNGDYESIDDLCRRADLRNLNRRAMESLIKAGAFDSLGDRGALLASVGRIQSLAQREQHLRETGQSTMFDLWGETMPTPVPSLELETAEASTKDRLDWERELMGVYLSEHPFAAFADKVAAENTVLCGQVEAELAGQTVRVAGMVASVHQSFTRDRRPFASVMLEDLDGRVEVMAWPDVYAGTRELWEEGSILLVEGKVRVRNDRVQLSCDNVRRYQPETAPGPPPEEVKEPEPPPPLKSRLTISIKQTENIDNDVACLNKLVDTLRVFPGEDEVNMCVISGDRVVNLKLSNIYTGYCPELHQRLVALVGEEGLKVVTQ